MKILHVNKFFFPEYGTEQYLFELMRAQEKAGHEVIHFSMQDPRNRPSKQAKYFVPRVDVSKAQLSLQGLGNFLHMIHYPLARKNFAKLLDLEKPELVHIHSIHHQISPSILKEAKKRNIPIVQTLHDYKLVAPSYHFPFRDGQVCTKCRRGNWLHLIKHRAHKNSYLATLAVAIESFIHSKTKVYEKNVDKFIVPSQNMRRNLVNFGVASKNIDVVPHFLGDDFYQKPTKQTLGRGILFAGRLAPERGLEHLLYFAQNLPKENFYVAGSGPEGEALQAKISALGLKNIFLLGRLSKNELIEAYRASRIVIFPSQTLETFGLTILEAMSQGKIVVATKIGAVQDLIKHNQNGFLYPVNQPDKGLAFIKNNLIESPASLKISEQAQAFTTSFNKDEHLNALNKIYDQLRATKKANLADLSKFHIAIMGHRGIPGNYGGFETFAEELATRLVKTGHKVKVYCRTNTGSYRSPTYKGVNLVYLSTWANKYFDTLVHTAKSILHAIFVGRPDVILMVNVGNAMLSWLPRIFGIPVILNVDGLEWERKKWNRFAKIFLRTSAWFSRWLPTAVVTDAKVIFDHYHDSLRINTTMIPYGASVVRKTYPDVLKKYGLKKEDYYLYVARFEPENNAHLVVKAFENVYTDKKLVMIGDAPYASKYCREVRNTKDPRIKFLGFVYGSDYKALQQNAYVYVQATEVGGTHPALIEGLGFGNCVLVNGTPENMETANGSAIPFWFFRGKDVTSGLTKKLQQVDDEPELVAKYRKLGSEHIRKNYRWDKVAQQYVDLIVQVKQRNAILALAPNRNT